MCCCDKPTVNGELGYKWNDPQARAGVYPVNPPALADNDVLLRDLPGRCGGQDSHSHHYCLVKSGASLNLLVRHGGGDERIRLSGPVTNFILQSLNSTDCYWLLNAIHHAQSNAARDARDKEALRWRMAAADKRIRTRKLPARGTVKVWIEDGVIKLNH